MPYNPNDPNSDPNNPEGEAPHIPETTAENAETPEDQVRRCYPHVMVRNQPKEAEATIAKLDKLLTDKRLKTISVEEADRLLDELVNTDIATYIKDPVAGIFVGHAVEAIRRSYRE